MARLHDCEFNEGGRERHRLHLLRLFAADNPGIEEVHGLTDQGSAVRRVSSDSASPDNKSNCDDCAGGDCHSNPYPQHPALHTNRPEMPMAFNEGIIHFRHFAKYAVAFPRKSRSIVTRANSARKRLISICSAVAPALPLTSFSVPAR